MTLRSRTIKLAHDNPELRPLLLPLLKEAAKTQPWKLTVVTNGEVRNENFVPLEVKEGGATWTFSVPEGQTEPDADQLEGIQSAVRAYRQAKADDAVFPLFKLADEFQPVYPPSTTRPAFAIAAASRSTFLSKMRDLGWGMEDMFGQRRVFVHGVSTMTIVAAEQDTFIIGS